MLNMPAEGINITATGDGLLEQSSATADLHFARAVTCIDDTFGDGFAKQNPDLIAAFMRTAVADLASAVIARAIEASALELASAVRSAAAEIASGGEDA
jgi:hypothetical protein